MSYRNVRPVTVATTAALVLVLVPLVSARQAGEPVKKVMDVEDGSRRQGFSVVLLLGDMQGGEFLDGVPTAARKALADMKDFLPYKNYRLLDSQWTLCCSGTSSAITRLRGVDDQEYELELRASPIFARPTTDSKAPSFEPGAKSVRFFLRELSAPDSGPSKSDSDRARDSANKGLMATSAAEARMSRISQEQELFALEREQLDLRTQTKTLKTQTEVGMKDPAELQRAQQQLALVTQRIEKLKMELYSSPQPKASSGPKAVIDTSFRIDVGETVVVGSSGLRGGSKALIALLTAVGTRAKER